MNWGSTSKWQVSSFLWQKLISKHWKALKDYSHPSGYREHDSHVFSLEPHVVNHALSLSPSDSKHPLSRWPHHEHWLDEEKADWTEECNLQIQWGICRYPAVRGWQDQLRETCKRRPSLLFNAWDWSVKLCLCHNLQILQNVQGRVVVFWFAASLWSFVLSLSSLAIQISKTVLQLLEYIV